MEHTAPIRADVAKHVLAIFWTGRMIVCYGTGKEDEIGRHHSRNAPRGVCIPAADHPRPQQSQPTPGPVGNELMSFAQSQNRRRADDQSQQDCHLNDHK